MTLLHPRTAPDPVATGEAEALIREARRLRRRRWTVGLLLAVVVATGVGWAVAARTDHGSVPPERVLRDQVTGGGLPEGVLADLTVAGPLAVAPDGTLYVADVARERVLARLADGRFRVVAGDGTKGTAGDGGPAVDAEFLDIADMAVGPDGSLYVVDGDRVRMINPHGVISTVAGIPGMPAPATCCAPPPSPPPIVSGTPARSVSIDQMDTAAIALSEQGVLYISTGVQLLRLDAGRLDVIAAKVIDPAYDSGALGSLGNLGQIAIDGRGDIVVSGGGGWAIWKVAPGGGATEVSGPNARRSGGNTSVLERGPDGVVYGESGGRFLKVHGDGTVGGYAFPSGPRTYFWLTYFAFGPSGTVYADEIPGSSGFERYQQLRVVRDGRSSVLWQQTRADVAQVAS